MDPMFYVTGFPSLSSIISSDLDQTASIYKRFDKLAARDLLYFQSELQELQARQDRFDREDAADVMHNSPEEWSIRENAQDWSSWKASAKKEKRKDARSRARMELAMKIRKTLKEYREALVLNASVNALPSPSLQSRAALSRIFHPVSNLDETILTGSSSSLYPDPYQKWHPVDQDYVSLTRPPDPDLLSYFLREYCFKLFPLYKRKNGFNTPKDTLTHAVSGSVRYYSLEAIRFAASFVSTVLAVALLFVPIYSLYHVPNDRPDTTMGLIAMFTTLFAATIVLVTNAKRGEIFGATAAYAAVLVVFVSGGFAAGGNGS